MPPEAWKSYTVSTKDTFDAASWTAQPHLICTNLQRSLLPNIDSATLFWRVGKLMQAGESTIGDVNALSLVGKYVRIEIPDLSIDWVGYVATEGNRRAADRDEGGNRVIALQDQQFTVVGLEWFLSRRQVDSTVYYETASTDLRVMRPIGFNTDSGDGRSISYADRGNKDTRSVSAVPVFAETPDQSELWDAAEIVEHLLFYHGPRDKDDNFEPLAFQLAADASQFLDWYAPTVQTEGRTILDVLGQVIETRRGLVWWTEYDPGADTFVTVKVSSSLASAIVLPSAATIPAALTQQSYNFDQDIEVSNANVNGDGSLKYDSVRVRGARRRSVFTVSIQDNNLETSWDATAEADYKTAEGTDADKNDAFRRANQFERVYKAFRIPSSWDGRASDGEGGTKDWVTPQLPPGSTSVIAGEPFNIHGLRLLRTMPLKAGFDYTDATNPTANLPADTKPEYLQPFCLVRHDTKFVFSERAAGHVDSDNESAELSSSVRLRPLQSEPGFELVVSSPVQHVIAEADFDIATVGATNVTPDMNFREFIFTVCAEWDAYCEGWWPTAEPNSKPVQELLVYASDRYRLDWLAQNTVFDIDDQGALKLVQTGGPLQDDRRILEDLARLAYEWYQIPRASLTVDYANLQQPVAIGTLINTIGTSGQPSAQTINATVSQVTLQPESGQSSLSANVAQLDIGGLA